MPYTDPASQPTRPLRSWLLGKRPVTGGGGGQPPRQPPRRPRDSSGPAGVETAAEVVARALVDAEAAFEALLEISAGEGAVVDAAVLDASGFVGLALILLGVVCSERDDAEPSVTVRWLQRHVQAQAATARALLHARVDEPVTTETSQP
jgi:hypothetical protein